MAVKYSTTLRNNRLDEITALAGATAHLQFWNGAVPSSANSAPAGTLLASCRMSNPIAPAAASGALTMSPITNDTSANAGGTPTFCRIATNELGTTTGIVQLSCAIGSGDVSIDNPIVATGDVGVTSLVLNDASS